MHLHSFQYSYSPVALSGILKVVDHDLAIFTKDKNLFESTKSGNGRVDEVRICGAEAICYQESLNSPKIIPEKSKIRPMILVTFANF